MTIRRMLACGVSLAALLVRAVPAAASTPGHPDGSRTSVATTHGAPVPPWCKPAGPPATPDGHVPAGAPVQVCIVIG